MFQSRKNNQKLRLAIACDIFLDGKDTRANHMLELFNNLNKFSETYLLVPKPNEIKIVSQNIKYVLWVDIPLIRLILYQIALFLDLFILCKKEKINVIYARQETFNISPLIISKLLDIPYVVELNGLLLEEKRLLGINEQLIKLTKFSEKINYRYAARIISVTPEIKNCIMQRYNIPDEKIVVVENGVNIDLFRPMEKDKLFLSLNLNKNYDYIGYIGSFACWHGLEYLIKSAPFVLEKLGNVKFILIGDGGLKNNITQLVDDLKLWDDFIFVGRVSHDEIPSYINIFDLCIILKDKNIVGSPLKLWEYMACAKPVVATNSSDFKILEKYKAGILVSPEKSDEVANAITILLSDSELNKQMGMNARKCVIESHSWKYVALKVSEICRDVMMRSEK